MDKFAEFVVGLFQDLKLPYRWGAIGVVLMLVFLGVLGFERVTGQFYFSRLERKITLLNELKQLKDAGITQDPELNKIYQDTVNELESFSVKQSVSITPGGIDFSNPVTIGKAIGGASFWLLVFVLGISADIRKNKKITWTTIGMGIFILLIALLFAWIGAIIPTIISPWVNYIGFPIFQISLLIYLSVKSAKPAVPSTNN
jgi:hypothetical protein